MAKELDIQAILSQFKKPFQSQPTYCATGDCIELFFEDTDSYSDRVDCWLTVYKSFDDDKVVGLMVKNVKSLLSKFDALGLECRVDRDKGNCLIRLQALVANVPWVESESAQRPPYRDVLKLIPHDTAANVELVAS